MPDLLLELFSEEIPARMQARAADDLKKMVTDKLVDAGLVYEGARAFATPRRLALTVQGVPARQPDLKEERKGPRVGAPDGAIAGFLKAAGLVVDQRSLDPEGPEEGRLLHRAHREAGPAGDRRDRRIPAGRAAHLPVAEVDALGRAVAQTRQPRMGAPAARDRRDLRARDRGAGDRARRDRRRQRRHDDLRPSLPCAGRDLGAPLRRLRGEAREGQGRARSGAPPRDHPERREESRVRARLRTGRGREPAERGRRPGRMAGRADGHVRRSRS